MLVEERDGPLLREAGGFLVVAWRGVVVEAVVGSVVDVDHEGLSVRLQRLLVGRVGGVDPLIQARELDHEGRLYGGHVLRGRGRPVERHTRAQIRKADGELIHHSAAVAEPDGPDSPGGRLVVTEEPERGHPVLHHRVPVELPLHHPALVVVAGIATQGG